MTRVRFFVNGEEFAARTLSEIPAEDDVVYFRKTPYRIVRRIWRLEKRVPIVDIGLEKMNYKVKA